MNKKNQIVSTISISAILPVYNVVEYIELAVESLIGQSLKNIEIILVNDGSTDGSETLVNDLSKKYEQVTVIHQKNAGAAMARNAGIKAAVGKYLYFMDPDDWAKPGMLEAMYTAAENHNAQLVITGFTNKYDDDNGQYSTSVKPDFVVYKTKKDFRSSAHVYLNNTMLAVPWNKLYSKNYIIENNLEFPSVKWDDLHFNLEAVKEIQKVVVVDNDDYQFLRTRPGSETTKVFDKYLFDKRKQQFEHVLEVFNYWNLNSSKTEEALNYYFSSRVFQVVQEIADSKSFTYKTKANLINKIINDKFVERVLVGKKGGSMLISIALLPLKYKNVLLSLLSGKSVSLIKNKFGKTFNNIRVKLMKV
ncbi:MAG: glycosyltransferase family 2 protein [Leuconostoc mesenteroides]